jgi:hypothetical protein|tara:strand:- start:160 stop:579 length:420 start_codon:yes stop_codon:yes gene_type:complete
VRSIDIYRERERVKSFSFLSSIPKVVLVLRMNGEISKSSFLPLSVCLRVKTCLSFSFSLVRVFLREVVWTTQEAKKASEREKESEGESAPQERQKDIKTDRKTDRKTRNRILGREDGIVSDDDDSDDERISSSTPGKIS